MDGVVLDTVIDDKVKQICYGKYRVKQICYTNMSATCNIQVSRHLFLIGLFSINLQKKVGKSGSVAFATAFTL